MNDSLFIVSQEDWSLHRKGHEDQTRHREKVKEALKNNLADLVAEEGVLTSNGKNIVKIPIRSLDEFRFRYNYRRQNHVGTGEGNTKKGDVVAKDGEPKQQGPGQGAGAGDQPGVDYFETEVTLEEVEGQLFSRLKLPHLDKKEHAEVVVDSIEFNDIRKKGIMGNLDKKRTILQAIKRNIQEGGQGLGKILEDDLRFKTWNEVKIPHSQAVVLCMMDTSGSMGRFEKDIARTTFFWISRFLRQNYKNVEIVFIAHHTHAKIVSEEHFFTKGEMGGTVCSSAYKLAMELIRTKYSPSRYNIYPIHFSDGDNLPSDNDECTQIIQKMMEVTNFFAYGEINQHHRMSTLGDVFKSINHPKLRTSVIYERKDILKALTTFFSESVEEELIS
ncbi:sporulation protein YhbH [Ammoniphilus sp. CFH 90114]|uniref:sporulation protein YhbH n=1 Tax=Ammoniphilus sp. CFH 90114 TaxID=2493665 RepID=UPI00100DE549|nr:sporulation protein YhbH [Ammoniphilus sp. CFH 90114]RXT14912.1 sporulation protein YhbH [Ammoniphilus sp. CFH 90114]